MNHLLPYLNDLFVLCTVVPGMTRFNIALGVKWVWLTLCTVMKVT